MQETRLSDWSNVSDITTETKHDVIKDKAFDNAALLTLLFDAV